MGIWKVAHEKLVLAVIGVALARRTHGLSLLAVTPYVEHRWIPGVRPTPRRLAGLAAYLAERTVAGPAEVAGTGRAALRHRTFLL